MVLLNNNISSGDYEYSMLLETVCIYLIHDLFIFICIHDTLKERFQEEILHQIIFGEHRYKDENFINSVLSRNLYKSS